MRNKIALCVLIIFFVLTGSVYAKDQQHSGAEDVVAKMTTELNLTAEQVDAVTPIVEETMSKRQAFLDSLEGELMVDKENVKIKMFKFKKEENEKLSKVLSQDQMQKLIAKQRLRASLNRGDIDYSEGVGTGGLSASAASLPF